MKRAQAAEALARTRLEIARRGLAATVTKNYDALIAAQRKYAIAQQALDQSERMLTTSEELERGREVAHSDVVKARLQVIAQQQALKDSQLALGSTRMDLAVLLFRDFEQNFSVVDDLDVAPALPAQGEVESMAGRENPTLGAAVEALRGARLDVNWRARHTCRH